MAPFLGLGIPELVVILVIILVLFGPRRLPQMGQAIGKTIRQLRKAQEGEDEEEEETYEEEEEEAKPKKKAKSKKKAKKAAEEEEEE